MTLCKQNVYSMLIITIKNLSKIQITKLHLFNRYRIIFFFLVFCIIYTYILEKEKQI